MKLVLVGGALTIRSAIMTDLLNGIPRVDPTSKPTMIRRAAGQVVSLDRCKNGPMWVPLACVLGSYVMAAASDADVQLFPLF